MRHSFEFHRKLRVVEGGRRRRSSRGAVEFRLALVGVVGLGAVIGLRWEPPTLPATAATTEASVRFGFCHTGGGTNCVVDGDTFWLAGERIRVADIDAPETHPPHCAEEARLGNAATARLQALLNAGPIALQSADRDTDRYGRKLRIVTRDGRSLGGMLVAEGLARPWGGRRRPWC